MSLLGKIDPLWRRVLSAAVIATGLLATAGMTTPVKAQYYGYPYYAGYCDPYYNPYACYGAYAYGYPYYGYGYGYPAAFIGFGFGGHRLAVFTTAFTAAAAFIVAAAVCTVAAAEGITANNLR